MEIRSSTRIVFQHARFDGRHGGSGAAELFQNRKEEDIMVAIGVSGDESEEFPNLSNIEDLARELGASSEEILFHYETALKELRPHARIKAFLPILAGRQVREIVLEKKVRIKVSNSSPAPNF